MSNAERLQAFRLYQSPLSLVCAATATLFFLTPLMHLMWTPLSERDTILSWAFAGIALILLIVPLALGHRMPRRLAMGAAIVGMVGIYVAVALCESEQLVLNAILLIPVIALAFGWFMMTGLARASMLVGIGTLLIIIGVRSQTVDWHALSLTTSIYIALLTGFLFEAGVYLHAQTERRASRDSLTGALNRYGFMRDGQIELHRAARTGLPLTVVVIDFDGLKELNDTRGHLAGDFALRNTIDEWRAGIRPYDLIVRLGGDEFALMLPGIRADNAVTIVQRLRAASDSKWSWGVAEWKSGESLDSLLARADAELLIARGR